MSHSVQGSPSKTSANSPPPSGTKRGRGRPPGSKNKIAKRTGIKRQKAAGSSSAPSSSEYVPGGNHGVGRHRTVPAVPAFHPERRVPFPPARPTALSSVNFSSRADAAPASATRAMYPEGSASGTPGGAPTHHPAGVFVPQPEDANRAAHVRSTQDSDIRQRQLDLMETMRKRTRIIKLVNALMDEFLPISDRN
jgi:hypothetical protein